MRVIARADGIFAACLLAAGLCGCATPHRPPPPDEYVIEGKRVQGSEAAARLIAQTADAAAADQLAHADRPPKLLRSVAPTMPRQAIERGIQGDVYAELVIEADGTVSSVRILKSPDELLSQAAIEAMKQWLFSPLIVQGVAKQFKARQVYTFRIQ